MIFFLFGFFIEVAIVTVIYLLLLIPWVRYVAIKKPSKSITITGFITWIALYPIILIGLFFWACNAEDEAKGLHNLSGNSSEARQESPFPPSMKTAISTNDVDMATQVLDSGFDPNTNIETDSGPVPALVRAADEGDVEIVQLLLEHGARVHPAGDEALTIASHKYSYDNIVVLLKDAGAHVLPTESKKAKGNKKVKTNTSR